MGEAPSSKTLVAIKVLMGSHTQGELEYIHAAVQTMVRLSHPGLLRIRDGGVVESHPFLVMDYAPYGSLRSRSPRGTILDPLTLLAMLKPLVSAVQFVHEHSLVHGNLKPENVLLGPMHALLLSDFGFVVNAASRRLTPSQEGMAALVYLAPEQLHGQTQFASDQYALGIMVYEWLSGDVPFHGSFEDLVQQQRTAAPPPL